MKMKKFLILYIILLCSISTHCSIRDFYLREMTEFSDLIVKARVIKVKIKHNNVFVDLDAYEFYKGNTRDTISFYYNKKEICNISDAIVGESGIYFLSKRNINENFRSLLIAGRGRNKIIFKNNDSLIQFNPSVIYPWYIVKNHIIDTLKNGTGLVNVNHYVKLTNFVDILRMQLKDTIQIKPNKKFPPPGRLSLDMYIQDYKISQSIDLETLYDGIPRIGNSKKILGFIFGTYKNDNVESKEVIKRMNSYFPYYKFKYNDDELIYIENVNRKQD